MKQAGIYLNDVSGCSTAGTLSFSSNLISSYAAKVCSLQFAVHFRHPLFWCIYENIVDFSII